MLFDPDETWRINRARLALRLHKLPAEIDAQPARDIEELIAVMVLDDMIAEKRRANA